MKELRGKTVLVTGAASGIGRASAMRFSAEGAILILVDINEEGLALVAREIEACGGTAATYRADMREASQVAELHRLVTDEIGTPDVLMNAAGVAIVACVEDVPLETWEWVIGLNLWSCIYSAHYFLPDMIARRSGHIVNVASGAGLFAVPYQAPYVASKFGVVGLSEDMRWELSRYGIGVSAVCPGAIDTPIIENAICLGFADSMKKGAYFIAASVDKLAAAIIKGVEKNRPVIMYPGYIKLFYLMKRLSPRFADFFGKAFAKAFYRQHYSG
ncbi:MAG: SDR family NAD(P)-dependent oxidoreductase [Candidatus Geothermincolia bacterium]